MARPTARAAPNIGDANAAAAPISTANSGSQTGRPAIENTVPKANAPTKVVGRLALNDAEGRALAAPAGGGRVHLAFANLTNANLAGAWVKTR